MPRSWSRAENEAAVADYLTMLREERQGLPYSKADHYRDLGRRLDGRSRPAIEKKHHNISAILLELGYPYIDGYKPLRNYQDDLREVVERYLVTDALLQAVLDREVEAPAAAPRIRDILAIEVEPPTQGRRRAPKGLPAHVERIVERDYLELESRNQALGRAGEECVLAFERARLAQVGRDDLIGRIEHTAQTRGDAAGFDVRSFEADGRDRFIEAKTTIYPKFTPFFLSRGELRVSQRHDERWCLYRLFDFRASPRLFILRGRVDRTCFLDAVQFQARTK